ncbi:hypothetical protein [Nostoc sp. 'Peltigera membranacea cyanobiont' 232]|uniref:hypothetical protein n=1 Tax=Nostoc sp. 'Peltigera membranacea cyanobiont' 232 TaxID=2014531 RepID=UPI000B956BF6|nr:hypothetical protein [Nostoc sp. 'Peltigera membranacea cyanobiont' 232]OYE02499.1 hypothetical protein CDG79_23620 [Nostoc sp. 'Peltigera membranacea cyanobiont' 232]
MELKESKAIQILNTYLKFCEAFQREGKITDNNFNRIRFINSCIHGKEDEIREVWGDLFDEIYCLLQKPEIKSRLLNLKSENSLRKSKCSNNLTASSKKIKASTKNRVQPGSESNKTRKLKKQKQANKLQSKIKNREYIPHEKSINQIRDIFWKSVERAKQEEEARKKLRIKKVQPIREVPPGYTFDESSTFEDVMDERRAEGKGYGGSK